MPSVLAETSRNEKIDSSKTSKKPDRPSSRSGKRVEERFSSRSRRRSLSRDRPRHREKRPRESRRSRSNSRGKYSSHARRDRRSRSTSRPRKQKSRKRRKKSNFTDGPTEDTAFYASLSYGSCGTSNRAGVGLKSYIDPSTKVNREVYIGNVPTDGLEPIELEEYMTEAIKQGGLRVDPDVNSILNTRLCDKFAFIEFRTVEDASNSLNLNGIVLRGRIITVCRPKQYVGPETLNTTWEELMALRVQENPSLKGKVIGLGASEMEAAKAKKTTYGDAKWYSCRSGRELYVGNVPDVVTSDQLSQFLSAAMKQSGLTVEDNNHVHPLPVIASRLQKRFAFVEFRSVIETDNAMHMTGIPLLNSRLRINRPRNYQNDGRMNSNWQELCAIGIDGVRRKYGAPTSQVPTIESVFPETDVDETLPTKVLQMTNMVEKNELMDEEEYVDIVEDIREEMEKFGSVLTISIPRPNSQNKLEENGVGMVYVHFNAVNGAIGAKTAVADRTFNNKKVAVYYYPEDLFLKGILKDISKVPSVAPSNNNMGSGTQPYYQNTQVKKDIPGSPPAEYYKPNNTQMKKDLTRSPPAEYYKPPQQRSQHQYYNGHNAVPHQTRQDHNSAFPPPVNNARGNPNSAFPPPANSARGRGRGATLPAWMNK